MPLRNTLGVWKYNLTRQVTRTVITQAIGFGTKRLIVFLTPGYDSPNGGIMSITAIYRESAALQDLHGAKVALCTVPGEPPLLKYTWFKNNNYLLDLESLLNRCSSLDYLLLHIPEYAVNDVAAWLDSHFSRLQKINEIHLNVLVQHIEIVQDQDLKGLARFGKVTCTTAHEAYTNAATRATLGVTLHRLSTFIGPERYTLSGHAEKQNLMMVSHDAHPLKERILSDIKRALPDLKVQIIQNLSFEAYSAVARRAKWSLTFGEGLDNYFCDPVFNGGVSFAVYNERFFTPAFAELETVYPSWEVLVNTIVNDLRRHDEPVAYEKCWRPIWELLSELYGTERFRENLRLFYKGEYTFP